MPNHCDQDLTVRGPAAQVADFLAQYTAVEKGGRVLSCESLIPYPKEFTLADRYAEASHEAWSALPVETRGPYPQIKDGFNSGGYEWCCENWGTKWGAYDGYNDSHEIVGSRAVAKLHFLTAWSPLGNRVLRTLSARIPQCTITLRYYEAGCGFKGMMKVQAGAIQQASQSNYSGSRGG